MIIDTHAHLDAEVFEEDRKEVIQRAFDAGISRIVNIGATDGWQGAHRSIALANEYEEIFCSVGIHPHDSTQEFDLDTLRELARHPKVRAIGETGLDFFRDWAPVDRQREWFRLQIELAKELGQPIIIHSRDAGAECLKTLQEKGAEAVGGVFHCYSEDANFAAALREINFLISFPGTLTFPKAETVREAAREIPLEQIMLETDSPYIAPVPYRGKRCESAYVVETAKALATVKEVTLEEIAEQTSANAVKFFRLEDS